MLDTIVLRIHGVRKYRGMLLSLDRAQNQGFTTSTGKVSGQEIDKLRGMGVKDTREVLDIMKMNGSGDFLVKAKHAKAPNASSHYSFAYMVNYTLDFIEFNFSIPKYTYGSNVLMFVDHLGERAYSFHECWHLEHNINRAYNRLISFLRQLFRLEFVNVQIDPQDVEVHRIDVCFNQVFNSKQEALKYLEYQKRHRKKYSRNEEGVMKDYETSLMYVTKRYSAKIYHKGTEYQKKDLTEHKRINQEKGRQYFRTEEYQAFADRMLRYELTLRTAMINYLYKRSLFRKKCPEWKVVFQIYQNVEAKVQKNDRIAQKIGTLPESEKEAYKKLHPYEKISSEQRKIYRYVSKTITKRTKFVFGLMEPDDRYNQVTVNYPSDFAFFSEELLKLCLYKLVEFMKEYQIKELPPEGIIEKRIDEYNLRNRTKLPKWEMMNFYKDLLNFGSFKETAKFTYLSRTTLYRYKTRFKKIGITDNNLIPLTDDGIPQADINLREYHYVHQYDSARFLKKNNFWDMITV